jgi:hypothetical protein
MGGGDTCKRGQPLPALQPHKSPSCVHSRPSHPLIHWRHVLICFNIPPPACVQEGSLPLYQAIQISYSYSHCDYSPTQLVQALVDQVQAQPGACADMTLTT